MTDWSVCFILSVMTNSKIKKSPRERIIETACDLFYKQGFHATGINQIISESAVAKASFYDHFPSKDELIHDYVFEMSKRDFADFCAEIDEYDTAEERFYGPLHILGPWFIETDYRGCPFQNVVSEIPLKDERILEMIKKHRARERDFFRQLGKEYIDERSELSDVDPDALADMYELLFDGAIANATAYRSMDPVESAIASLKNYLGR